MIVYTPPKLSLSFGVLGSTLTLVYRSSVGYSYLDKRGIGLPEQTNHSLYGRSRYASTIGLYHHDRRLL